MNLIKAIKSKFSCPFPREWIQVSLKVEKHRTCPHCGYFGKYKPVYFLEHYHCISVEETLDWRDPLCRNCHEKFDDPPKLIEYVFEADEFLPRWKERELKNFSAIRTVNNA